MYSYTSLVYLGQNQTVTIANESVLEIRCVSELLYQDGVVELLEQKMTSGELIEVEEATELANVTTQPKLIEVCE